jgi:hypothetical protein
MLVGQKFVGFEPDIPTRKALDKILREHGVSVNNVMEFDNVETVKRAVEIDAGVSIVPQGTVTQEISKQTLAAVPLEDGSFFRPLAAIYKKNKVLSPAMKQFLALLKERTRRAGRANRKSAHFRFALARREVQRPGDLLIEQDVAHRIQDVRIEAQRKFARRSARRRPCPESRSAASCCSPWP